MDNSFDDEIQRLSADEDQTDHRTFVADQQSSVNPSFLYRHAQSLEESIDPASIHALQTAFSSLQKKHNEQARKYHELHQRNKIMQKALMELDNQSEFKAFCDMDEVYVNDPGSAQGAGASEAETVIAENRAKQGYISHLEKEVLRNNSAILKGNEEISRLKKKLEEVEKDRREQLQNRERLHEDLAYLSQALDNLKEENEKKDNEIERLGAIFESEKQSLIAESNSLRERIVIYEHAGSSNSAKNAEIQDLNSRLTLADTEMKKLIIQFRDIDNQLKAKEREVSTLEAQCKQFEIEVEISRKNNQRVVADSDEVDGEIDILTKALGMIASQRGEIGGLKSQLEQQQNLIQKITDVKGLSFPQMPATDKFQEARPNAQGASMNEYDDEESHQRGQPLYMNAPAVLSNVQYKPNSSIPQNKRRQSDKSDYRSPPQVSQMTSPKINDSVKLTGNKQIAHMTATEISRPGTVKRNASNVFDSHINIDNSTHAVASHSQFMNYGNAIPNTDVQRINPSVEYRRNSPNIEVNPNSMNSEIVQNRQFTDVRQISPNRDVHDSRRASGEYYNTSPRTRANEPSPTSPNEFMTPASQPKYANIDTGARPRVPASGTNYLNLQYNEPKPHANNRIPDRMTQSEIILRGEPQMSENVEFAMQRSVFSPLSPLAIPAHKVQRSSENMYMSPSQIVQGSSPNDHVFLNNYADQNNGPDYENIYNVKEQTEIKRPLDEHEDNTFTNRVPNNNRTNFLSIPSQEEGSEVSALKVCPVCNEEFSRLTMDQFQTHVFECFDSCDESPATLQPTDDRNCPMCEEVFPLTISQETFEQHVLGHFGEDPLIERFEMLTP